MVVQPSQVTSHHDAVYLVVLRTIAKHSYDSTLFYIRVIIPVSLQSTHQKRLPPVYWFGKKIGRRADRSDHMYSSTKRRSPIRVEFPPGAPFPSRNSLRRWSPQCVRSEQFAKSYFISLEHVGLADMIENRGISP